MPSPGPLATFENLAATKNDSLAYGDSGAPCYYELFLKVPNLLPLVDPLMPQGGLSEHVLVQVRYEVFIIARTPAVNTAGILCTEFAFANLPDPNPPAFLSNTLPILDQNSLPLIAQAYDPTGLPIGGVNFPIWTRAVSDPLIATIYANDTENTGRLWAMAFIQINAALTGEMVGVLQHIHWDFAETGDRQTRPLVGAQPW